MFGDEIAKAILALDSQFDLKCIGHEGRLSFLWNPGLKVLWIVTEGSSGVQA